MNREERVERRRDKRFYAQDGLFVGPKAHVRKLWQIIDISRGGLAFRYVANEEESKGSSELDILTSDARFSLEKIPFKSISDSAIATESTLRYISVRRRSVQFGKLTDDQKAQLEYLILNYTVGEA